MTSDEYQPVDHDHEDFLERARQREGFAEAYDELEADYDLTAELVAARARAGLTQEDVAAYMGTTKSSVSRLESGRKHSPSIRTLEKYAEAAGCTLEIRLVPRDRR